MFAGGGTDGSGTFVYDSELGCNASLKVKIQTVASETQGHQGADKRDTNVRRHPELPFVLIVTSSSM